VIGPGSRSLSTARASLFLAALPLLVASCGPNDPTAPGSNGRDACPAGQWAVDTDGYRSYRHDCAPYVSEHFTVFSDGSSMEAKAELAGIAEDVFSELVGEFEIESEAELGFTAGYTYYIFAQRYISPATAEGYRNGFLIIAVDTPERPAERNPAFYRYLIKHEMTHVFQFSLTDCPRNSACPYWLDVWFREGQAIVTGDYLPLPTLAQYQTWISDPEHINPILISRWTDFPDPDRGGEYYPMFALTYAYLTDSTRGHGASVGDYRDLFQLMKDGEPFTSAFEMALGISLSYLEEHYYDIMEAYLGG
jgi:hypothetical protein